MMYSHEQLIELLKSKISVLYQIDLKLARNGTAYAPTDVLLERRDVVRDILVIEESLGIDRGDSNVLEVRADARKEKDRLLREKQERERQSVAMSTWEREQRELSIRSQFNQLDIARKNLAHYQAQAKAFGGIDLALPIVRNGTIEELTSIQRIKNVLRQYGYIIEDLPGE